MEQATLGGGCFWCLEAVYKELVGVQQVVSGYAGGPVKNPDYKSVCGGGTGHAEVVQITYDAQQITYGDLLEVFWHVHDPTTLNRQGNDVGTQYRSIILTHDENQQRIAEASRQAAQADFGSPIVTQIQPLEIFYPGEGYHQDYFENNPGNSYCRFVVGPKVEKFRKKYQARLKS